MSPRRGFASLVGPCALALAACGARGAPHPGPAVAASALTLTAPAGTSRAALEQTATRLRGRLARIDLGALVVRVVDGGLAIEGPGAAADRARLANLATTPGRLAIHAALDDGSEARALALLAGDPDRPGDGARDAVRAARSDWQGPLQRREDYFLAALDGAAPERRRAELLRFVGGRRGAAGLGALVVALERWRDEDGREGWRSHLLEPDAALTSADVVDARAEHGQVAVTITAAAAARLESLTRRMVGRRVAILLDDVVMSGPIVMEPITGRRLTISAGDVAIELAAILAGGPLLVPLVPAASTR